MTIPADHMDILDKRAFAHVGTLDPNGSPQSSPVWFDWDGQYLKFSQTTARQKYRNLRRDGRIAVSIIDPDEPYRYLEIRGTAERIEDDHDNVFINKLAKKYLDKDVYPWPQPGEHRVVVFVRPQRVVSQ